MPLELCAKTASLLNLRNENYNTQDENKPDGVSRLDTAKEKISRREHTINRRYSKWNRKTKWNKKKNTAPMTKKENDYLNSGRKASNKIQHPILIRTPAKHDKKGASSTCKRCLPKQTNENYS